MAETIKKSTAKTAVPKAQIASAKPAARKPAAKASVTSAKPAAKKPVAKAKAVSTKPVAVTKKAAAPKKPAVAKVAAKTTKKVMVVSDEQRYRMIAEAAYYRAESNQFKSDSIRDWIEAESDIASLLSGSK